MMIKGTTFEIKLTNKKILLAGPWVGEFGWELFCWQGHLRKISKDYDEIIIMGRKGHEFLYSDFMTRYIEYESPTSHSNMWMGKINNGEIRKHFLDIKPTTHIVEYDIGFNWDKRSKAFDNQEFKKYESNALEKKFDIILHPRNRVVGSNRNWEKKKWQELVNRLVNDKYSIAVIGTQDTYLLNGVDDYRNISIEETVSLFNRCKLVVGQSSGPMHLASLCGTPHFVWSSEHNRIRYIDYWNPHKTPVHFYSQEEWNPEVRNIYNRIKKYIDYDGNSTK